MAKKEFKSESKRLLDMMINSIYTHKEIFLRELISNASDAIDKFYFLSLKDTSVGMNKDDFAINIAIDKDKRTLTISDNGIGMTEQDLENNLGTIAKSGSLNFKKENTLDEETNIIGQFGVGFYSAFMVSKLVEVTTKAYKSDKAYKWESEGAEGYTITETQKDTVGTEIVLHLLDNSEDENYDEYLEQFRIQSLVKKYSDYIRFPIKMDCETQKMKEGTGTDGKEPEYETIIETKTLNSMVPIWRKNKNELKDEDYNNFYTEKFMDYMPPLKYMHVKAEGMATYNALLYVPSKAPYDYYSKNYEKGLQLYSNGVMIMEKCADLLPDYFSFVKGLVDSEDLSLNISREMLQHDRQLKIIEKNLERTIKNNLMKMQKDERDKYDEFFTAFGLQLKFGVYSSYGQAKDLLQDLLMFRSSFSDKYTTLSEYVSRMKEDQKFIYYASGESAERIAKLPQTELVADKGYEILYFTDDVDEFAIKMIMKYEEKEFKSVSSGDLGLESEEEKKEVEQQVEENKDLFTAMKEALDGKVKEVKLSSRLKSHPVCLSNDGEISMEMEKVLNAMPNDQKVNAEKILEINATHPVFEKLKGMYPADKETVKKYADILYNQALLIEGLPIEDPVAFSNAICDIMIK